MLTKKSESHGRGGGRRAWKAPQGGGGRSGGWEAPFSLLWQGEGVGGTGEAKPLQEAVAGGGEEGGLRERGSPLQAFVEGGGEKGGCGRGETPFKRLWQRK